MAAAGCVLAALSILISVYLFTKIQDSRRVSLTEICNQQSVQNQKIIDYLASLGARPESIRRAAEFFPVQTREQCSARAHYRVDHP